MTSNHVCRATHKTTIPGSESVRHAGWPAHRQLDELTERIFMQRGKRREAVGEPRKCAPASVAQLAPSAVLKFY